MNTVQNKISDLDLLLQIFDQLPTSIYVKDSDLRFRYSNAHSCRLHGRAEHEVLGRSDAELWPEEKAKEFLKNDRHIMESGEVFIKEEDLPLFDGSLVTVLTRKARIFGSDGKAYLIGTNVDMTDLRKRENQYKALSETVPVGVAQIDENNEVSFSNPLFNAYCGGDGTEADQQRLFAKLKENNQAFPGEACKFEAVVQGLGNQPRTMLVVSSGWLDLGEASRSATVSLIDISQMIELQKINDDVSRLNAELAENMSKLKKAQDDLVKRGRMEQLGQLTATVAHELRNPLGAVRTSAFLLERKLKDKNLGIEGQLDRINNGIVRCDNIITQLLDFSRTSQLQFQPGDLDAWLTHVVEDEAKKLPASVEIELILGLEGQTVPFDPSRLQRAIINMISNAVEAIIGSGDQLLTSAQQSPKLVVSSFEKNGHCSIRIADNGPGIPAEVLGRIREPLFTTKNFGTGLGIPAIEQIAVQHGGRLDIETEVGAGSTFTLWLPMVQVHSEETEKAA